MKNKVASVIFINNKNEILLYLRDDKPSIPHPNQWALLGGHLEGDESPIQALKREIKEEINLDLKTDDIKFLSIVDDLVGNEAHIYKSRIEKDINRLRLTEGQKLKFFKFEELAKIKIPAPLKKFIIKNKNDIFSLG